MLSLLSLLTLFLLHLSTALDPSKKCDVVPTCYCPDRYTVNCTGGARMDTTDVFRQITPSAFPNLETLIVSGHNLTSIEPDLFGFDKDLRHHHLSRLVLSRNAIRHIDGAAFEQMPMLEELDLSHNLLSVDTEHMRNQKRMFANLPRLKKLWLTAAIDELTNMTKQTLAWSRLFENGTLQELKHLDLESNGFEYIPAGLLCTLPALEWLMIGDNDIGSFNPRPDCIRTLRHVDLSDNRISVVGSKFIDLIENADHAPKVDLAGNTFICNCHLKKFVSWAKTTKRLLYKEQMECEEPASMVETKIVDIDPEELSCKVFDGTGHLHGVYISIALAMIGLICIAGCFLYFNRRFPCPTNVFKPQTVGYAQLQKEEAAQAEFV